MDRRSLLKASLTYMGASAIACCGRVRAASVHHGCQLKGAADDPDIRVVRSSGDPTTDLLVRTLPHRQRFGVAPAMLFFDDRASPNAYATPQVFAPENPDGTVLLGITILSMVKQASKLNDLSYFDENSTFIAFHEMGHILQFKRGISGTWQVEPHADFLAGWAYANSLPAGAAYVRENLELGVKLMLALGDTDFTNPAHHGEPEFRAAMVRAGFDSANLDLEAAFERGKKYAGLT